MNPSCDITKLIDATLDSAKSANVPSEPLTRALDAIRASASKNDPFELWDVIDDQIGRSESPALQSLLVNLRAQFQEHFALSEIGVINDAFRRQSADAAWEKWISIVASSISVFRLGMTQRLCAAPFVFPRDKEPEAAELRRAAMSLVDRRWWEVSEVLTHLAAKEFLPALVRAKLLATVAEIQLYHFGRPAASWKLLESANQMGGDDLRVISATGDYWFDQKNLDKAEACFRRAIELAPGKASGYSGMGDLCERQNQLDTAEEWYKKAIAAGPGESDAYTQLAKLYGRPELFTSRQGFLPSLIERIVAIAPETVYQTYLDVGDIYKRNKQYDAAYQWYGKAAVLQPARTGAYVAIANCKEEQELFSEAEDYFNKTITAAPKAYDGYWGLADLYERQKNWENALKYYKNALELAPEWASGIRARIGGLYVKMQRFSEAESELKAALEFDKENPIPKDTLEDLAEEYYQKRQDVGGAQRIYDAILSILGESYNASYHNSLGNVSFYLEDYSKANEEYRQAVAAKPNNAVFHRNLAVSYRELGNYEAARRELDAALPLDKDTQTYNRNMALIANGEGNSYYSSGNFRAAIDCYQQAVKFDPNDAVIHSNLARAWERLKDPGKGIDALANAVRESERAREIAPNTGYEGQIQRLNRKKAFAENYSEAALEWVHVVTALAVEVAANLIPYITDAKGDLSGEVMNYTEGMRQRMLKEFGVRIPGVRFRGNESEFPDGLYVIIVGDVPLVSGQIALDKRFFAGTPEALATLGIKGEPAVNPWTGENGAWVRREDWAKVEAHSNFELWQVFEYAMRHLEFVVRRNLVEFIGHQEVFEIADSESTEYGQQLTGSPEEFSALAAVCRGLLAEEVPIKPFNRIYRTFHDLYSAGQGRSQIVEQIRSLPQIRPKLPGNDDCCQRVPLAPRFEEAIRRSVYNKRFQPILAMYPVDCQNALNAVRKGISGANRMALIADDKELRPFVRLLTELEFPGTPVLARPESLEGPSPEAPPIEWEGQEVQAPPNFASDQRSGTPMVTPQQAQITPLDDRTGSSPTQRTAINVFVSGQFISQLAAPLESLLASAQKSFFDELGLFVPEVHLALDSSLAEHEFRFQFNELSFPRRDGLKQNEFLANETVSRLASLNIEARPFTNPEDGNACAIVEGAAAREACERVGVRTWDSADFIVHTLSGEIRKNAAIFQTSALTQYMIDCQRVVFPALVNIALSRFSVDQITLVLRELLEEEISIKDFRSILEGLLSVNGVTDVDMSQFIVLYTHADNLCPVSGSRSLSALTMSDYAAVVRAWRKRYISHKYTRGASTLIVHLLDRDIEKRFSNADLKPLSPEECRRLIDAVRTETQSLPMVNNPVLLTSIDVRRPLRKVLQQEFPHLAVLSYQELSPDMNIQPLARISWKPAPDPVSSSR